MTWTDEQKRRKPELSIDDGESPTACQRHVTVTIPQRRHRTLFRQSVQRLDGLRPPCPAFAPGRAPRKLIEARFRKDVTEQVKGSLLMDSMTQITEDKNFSAISEPDFDPSAIEVPDDGSDDLRVRSRSPARIRSARVEGPEDRAAGARFNAQDVDKRLEKMLTRHGRLVPFDGPAAVGDYISCKLTFKNGDEVISRQQGRSDPHSPGAQFPRRQDRELRQADEGRQGRRDPRRQSQAQPGRAERSACAARRSSACSRCWKSRSWNCPS